MPKTNPGQKPKLPLLVWLATAYMLIAGLVVLLAINFSLDSNTYKDQAAYSLVVSIVCATGAGVAFFGLRNKYRNVRYIAAVSAVFVVLALLSTQAYFRTPGYNHLGFGDTFSSLWQALYVSLVFVAGPLFGLGLIGANAQSTTIFRKLSAGVGIVLIAFTIGFILPVQAAMTDYREAYQSQLAQDADQTAQEDAAYEAATQQQRADEEYLRAGIKPTLANIYTAAQTNAGVIPGNVEPPAGYSFVHYSVTVDRDAWSEAQVCIKGTGQRVIGIVVQYTKTDSSLMYSPSAIGTTCHYAKNFMDYRP